MLAKIKSESESRMNEEKKIHDRKRNIIVLILRYLANIGYIDSCSKISTESHIGLDQWDVADNIDLYQIVTEFEHYYELKFGKYIKLVRKVTSEKNPASFPKITQNNKVLQSANSQKIQQQENNIQSTKQIQKRNTINTSITNEQQINSTPQIEIQGQSAFQKTKEEEQTQNFFDVRVLKGMPDFGDVQELKELAAYLQRDIVVENPNCKFKDIVGLEDAKRLLKEAVLIPLKYPHFFTGILEPWRGVLLYGPPGTGKTMLAKAVATECGTTFFNISASSVVSKWRGESEKLIRVLFELARHYQPSTIFLDELDSIMSQRKGGQDHEGSTRMKTELLIQLDGLMKNKERVFLLAASNLPWDLDIAMLRRLEKRILVPLPCEKAREEMIRQFLPQGFSNNLNYNEISMQLENYSGSDIKLLCKEAAMKPLRKLINNIEMGDESQQKKNSKNQKTNNSNNIDQVKPDPVTQQDIQEALQTTKPSSFIKTQVYEKWEQEHGSV
ncbi:hypothetical protein IMG5_076290 [Ichthyophthirius multifiliis]|uniref:Katanin p60 ATPase-containing subunit A-like 2 n=1 Tax=Ichthyophthirius multifiliis TaxID=5932 RepID=G0QQ98_ICHMU|nr:hypothetical protein IMG5_076290 [Ichthyophthirius multifiliis]EGR32599.1 hypothetical protein IMG5_076290 [Ichthyophthirius multifiliis]|eukprot:XP_004036585.1 hypothetical protein IMG5_076290 [Ichthyophthirius multifiliis]